MESLQKTHPVWESSAGAKLQPVLCLAELRKDRFRLMAAGLQEKNLVQINSDVTAPVLYFPFLKGELMDEAGMTGNGQWKSSCSLFKANTKSSTRAALARSLHNQPMSSKPNCAAKQPRSFNLISSNRRRACRQSIMSMYMFSAQSLSLLHL